MALSDERNVALEDVGSPNESRSFYCHWDTHNQNVLFSNESDFGSHLKDHIGPETNPGVVACHWDSCHELLGLDDIMDHLKVSHWKDSNHPHDDECSGQLDIDQGHHFHQHQSQHHQHHHHDHDHSNHPQHQHSENEQKYKPPALALSPEEIKRVPSAASTQPSTPVKYEAGPYGGYVHVHDDMCTLDHLQPHSHSNPHAHSHSFLPSHAQDRAQAQAQAQNSLHPYVHSHDSQGVQNVQPHFHVSPGSLVDHLDPCRCDSPSQVPDWVYNQQYPARSQRRQSFSSGFGPKHSSSRSLAGGSVVSHQDNSAGSDHPAVNLMATGIPLSSLQVVNTSEPVQCRWATGNQICGEVFNTTHELNCHLESTHLARGLACYVCDWDGCARNREPFAQRQKAVRHLQVHAKNWSHKCPICGHLFNDDAALRQHRRIHMGEKPHECDICGKRFAAGSSLTVHRRTHTGEKPLMCKFPGCGKCFSESSNLAKHMKTHGPKRFECQICQRKFTRRDQLRRHINGSHRDEIEQGQGTTAVGQITSVTANAMENVSRMSPPLVSAGETVQGMRD